MVTCACGPVEQLYLFDGTIRLGYSVDDVRLWSGVQL